MAKASLVLMTAILLGSAGSLRAQAGGQQQPALPEGSGSDVVEATCTGCHNVNQIRNSAGYSQEGWQDLIRTMVRLPNETEAAITSYLATHFPPKPGRAPVLISGPETITIREWVVPTLGQRSRDPVEAPDGSIWWTGMWASLAGRLDPETGEMREYRLDPEAKPHSVIPDAQGNIWYTGNSNATIGRLDPRTGEITVYPTTARDPHSGVFDQDGIFWFTAQRARMIGRLNPETGELKEVATEPNPYGIQVDSHGTVWVAYNGTNKIGSVDPETMEIRYYELPDPESRVRRLGLDSDDMVWFVNSSLGRIGRLDPTTGEVREWASPSGPDSHPYALAVVDDIIWYNESGQRPDALVRFDPETEEFQSWAIPSGVGIVRNMWVTRAGDLLIHQTSSNRIGLVEIGSSAVSVR